MNPMVATHQTPRLGRWAAALLAVLLVMLGLGSAPVKAATLDGMLSFNGFHVGAFRSSSGALVYCLEPAANAPLSTQLTPVRVSSLPGYSIHVNDEWGWNGQVATSAAGGEQLRQMNWVLAEHAPGASPERAVAVQVALWELRREVGNASWIDGKYQLMRAHGGGAYVSAGIALAAQARSEAVGPGHVHPNGNLEIQAGAEHGSGTVSYPAGTTELTLNGGTFADGSQRIVITDGAAGSASWNASLHEPTWSRYQEVAVTGSWELAERYWPAELVLHPSSKVTEQRLGSAVAPVDGVNTGSFDPAMIAIDSQFVPAIVTAVPELIVDRESGMFADTVTVSASPDSAPWPTQSSTGAYLPLTASGTLYGPYNVPQEEQATAPASAPIAATSSLVLDGGPGSYSATASAQQLEAGYYYWVWAIHADEQAEEIRAAELLQPGAVYADNFGVAAEGQIVPTELRWITKLKEHELSPENLVVEDTVKVSLQGGAWLIDAAGERIPANIRFTAYQTDTEPTRQTAPPESARELGHVFAEVAEAETWVDAPPITLPDETRGWVSVRACLFAEDQADAVRGYVTEWCDDFGVPDETAHIIVPEVPQTAPVLAETGSDWANLAMISGAGAIGTGALALAAAGLLRSKTRGRKEFGMGSHDA